MSCRTHKQWLGSLAILILRNQRICGVARRKVYSTIFVPSPVITTLTVFPEMLFWHHLIIKQIREIRISQKNLTLFRASRDIDSPYSNPCLVFEVHVLNN